MRILKIAAMGAAATSLLMAANVTGDARRGEQIFQNERCIQCHSINGRGGTAAPDLGKHIAREFTPAAMAGMMWNHAPEMWSVMRQAGIVKTRCLRNRPPTCSPISWPPGSSKNPGMQPAGSRRLGSYIAPTAMESWTPRRPALPRL
jgi:hypothetical protein